MVYKLRPLKVKIDFDDRAYNLGDAIDVYVELMPGSDVEVREARVDLVCEQLHTRQEAGSFLSSTRAAGVASGPAARASRSTGSGAGLGSQMKQRVESYVHSSAVFLEGTTLRSGSPSAHRVRLQIQPAPPRRFKEAVDLHYDARAAWAFKWRLEATVNVVRGRNPRTQRVVQIALPPAPSGGAGGRPRMSRPKKPTGPSSGAS